MILENEMKENEAEFQKKLHLKAQLSESESSRIMKLHKQQMNDMESKGTFSGTLTPIHPLITL